jgi:hypothetical protein
MPVAPFENPDPTYTGGTSVAVSGTATQTIPVSSSLQIQWNIEALQRLPDDHPAFALIGRVAAEWSYLEHTLDRIIWRLSKDDAASIGCITAQLMGAAPRYKAIHAQLIRLGSPPRIVDAVNSLMQSTFDISEKRNRIIHDVWYAMSDLSPAQFRVWPKKDQRFGISNVDLDDIQQTLDRIRQLSDRAEKFLREMTAPAK